MDGFTLDDAQAPERLPARRPSDLVRLVALMAAHRDSVATPHGRPVPLEQHQVDSIVARLSGVAGRESAVRPASTGRLHRPAVPGR